MPTQNRVRNLDTTLNNGAPDGGTFFSITPTFAISAAHLFIEYRPNRNADGTPAPGGTLVEATVAFTRESQTDITNIGLLRGFEAFERARAATDNRSIVGFNQRDIATFTTPDPFPLSDLTGLGAFLNRTQLIGEAVTAIGFPGEEFGIRAGRIDDVSSDNGGAFIAGRSNAADCNIHINELNRA
ncbi:MAG: hypothetical protein AAFY83_14345 [Pseudomonadota bacterium]